MKKEIHLQSKLLNITLINMQYYWSDGSICGLISLPYTCAAVTGGLLAKGEDAAGIKCPGTGGGAITPGVTAIVGLRIGLELNGAAGVGRVVGVVVDGVAG